MLIAPPEPPWGIFFPFFFKCLILSPANPQICFVTPYIAKINSRQEGVKLRMNSPDTFSIFKNVPTFNVYLLCLSACLA